MRRREPLTRVVGEVNRARMRSLFTRHSSRATHGTHRALADPDPRGGADRRRCAARTDTGAAVLHPGGCGAELRAASARSQARSADLLPAVYPAIVVLRRLAVSQARVPQVPARDHAARIRA